MCNALSIYEDELGAQNVSEQGLLDKTQTQAATDSKIRGRTWLTSNLSGATP